jgi:rare lipoprotein A
MTLRARPFAVLIVLALTLAACASPQPASTPSGGHEHGLASWYGGKFHGRRTASGEVYDQNAMTAAHKTLPFGTRVRVTNLKNGRSAVLRINDRGPFVRGRIIDVSRRAADHLGFRVDGVTKVEVQVVQLGS